MSSTDPLVILHPVSREGGRVTYRATITARGQTVRLSAEVSQELHDRMRASVGRALGYVADHLQLGVSDARHPLGLAFADVVETLPELAELSPLPDALTWTWDDWQTESGDVDLETWAEDIDASIVAYDDAEDDADALGGFAPRQTLTRRVAPATGILLRQLAWALGYTS